MMERSIVWRWAFWACALVVLMLAVMPIVPYMPSTGWDKIHLLVALGEVIVPHMPSTGWDKSNHMMAFVVLAVLGRWAYPGRMAVLLLGLLAYGGLIEVLQSLTPDRFAEWADLLADAVGLMVGAGLASLLRRFS